VLVTNPFGPGSWTRNQIENISKGWWVLVVSGVLSVVAGGIIVLTDWSVADLALFVGIVLVFRGFLTLFSVPIDGSIRAWSIVVGLLAMIVALSFGTMLGLVAGYLGGRTEQVIMRFADGYQAIPEILLAIVVVAVFGGGVTVLILVLGFAGWETYTRVAFNLTRSLRERPFVEAAVASGAGGGYVMWRHILPQMSPVLTVIATLQVGQLILQETALSFLGLGLPPPTATWGNILAEGRDRLLVAPWIANLAGCAIVLLVLGVNLLGNGLRETLDPRRADRR